ncbi:energy transducer TonB [Crocinitomix algicola]|uniref:energy transducer TonB n=1 Tax=Crocinitomix algicola TaxID=1740263 RepID=UPI00083408E5|nr:energy transducer TonB [Crocinitomix algicola]
MKKSLIVFVLTCLIRISAWSEAAPYSMDELLLKSNLIAHVKITSHTENDFKVYIVDVLHHHKSGIKNGDYLTVVNDFNVICPSAFSIERAEQKSEALAFLMYHNGQWHLNQGEIGFFSQGRIEIPFYEEGCTYNGTIEDWKNDLTDYFNHFSYDKNGRLTAKYNSNHIKNSPPTSLALLQYNQLYHHLSLNLSVNNKLVMNLIFPPENSNDSTQKLADEIYLHVDQPPIKEKDLQDMMNDLVEYVHTTRPEIKANNIQGTSYYSLTFDKSGKITDVQIIRSISPIIDQAIYDFYERNNLWSPALLNNQAVRFQQNLPLRIK